MTGIKPKKVKTKRKPITLTSLKKIIKASEECLSEGENKVFKTIVTLLFFGFFRISEVLGDKGNGISHINRRDVRLRGDKLTIKLKSYKHCKGKNAKVNIKRQKDATICPVKAMHEYIQEVKPKQCLFKNKFGSPLSKNSFSKLLKQCSIKAGYNNPPFTSHCFRIGAATYASKIGHTDTQIKSMGRWKSGAFMGYIREADALVTKKSKTRKQI